MQSAAEGTGAVGVPHYVWWGGGGCRPLGLFGREHLALLRGKMHAAGLARRPSVSPGISHAYVPGE